MTPPPAASARARAVPAPAPYRRPIAPRRVSGPARAPRALPSNAPAAGRLLTRLLDAPVLDRLIRGRTWIAFIGFALLGIVAMQVTILRVGASIGRSVSQIEQITERNEQLETTVAGLEPGRDVASEAAALGMVYPPADNVGYLTFHAGDAALAAASFIRPTVPLLVPESPSLTAPLSGTAAALSTSTTGASSTTSASTTAGTSTTTAGTSTTTAGTSTTTAGTSTTEPPTTTASTPVSTTSTTSGGADLAPTGGAVTAAGGSSAPSTDTAG